MKPKEYSKMPFQIDFIHCQWESRQASNNLRALQQEREEVRRLRTRLEE